jgi:VIT1/CCC1 family predicted Fe2+/Mn2+ transporter
MSVQRELFESQIALERQELEENPEWEREEVSIIFRAKGLSEEDADRIADHIIAQPEVALDLMAREELGLNPDDLGSPAGAAVSSFASFALGAVVPLLPYIVASGAVVPLLPYIVASGAVALGAALLLAAIVLMTVGGLTARLSQRPVWFGAGRALAIGALATGVTYLVGRIVGVAVT